MNCPRTPCCLNQLSGLSILYIPCIKTAKWRCPREHGESGVGPGVALAHGISQMSHSPGSISARAEIIAVSASRYSSPLVLLEPSDADPCEPVDHVGRIVDAACDRGLSFLVIVQRRP